MISIAPHRLAGRKFSGVGIVVARTPKLAKPGTRDELARELAHRLRCLRAQEARRRSLFVQSAGAELARDQPPVTGRTADLNEEAKL